MTRNCRVHCTMFVLNINAKLFLRSNIGCNWNNSIYTNFAFNLFNILKYVMKTNINPCHCEVFWLRIYRKIVIIIHLLKSKQCNSLAYLVFSILASVFSCCSHGNMDREMDYFSSIFFPRSISAEIAEVFRLNIYKYVCTLWRHVVMAWQSTVRTGNWRWLLS